MIKAIIFDLDGTLVQTEALKAESYGEAAAELCKECINPEDFINAFKEVVGLPRQEVAENLITRFHLEKPSAARMAEYGVQKPWQAFVQMRMNMYQSMLDNPQIILDHLCPYNLAVLTWARQNNYPTGLATMSHWPQAKRVLKILDLHDKFTFIATRDDVQEGKPDPEIYLLVAKELGVKPAECLVMEDSVAGVKAALAAEMGCISVVSDYTRDSMHKSKLLDGRWIVESNPGLVDMVKQYVTEH